MNKFILYGHGSSYNHGCEAIVRSTVDLLNMKKSNIILYSEDIQSDFYYQLNNVVQLKQVPQKREVEGNSLRGLFWRVLSRISKYDYDFLELYDNYRYLIQKNAIALSIGGDNYCYRGFLGQLKDQNRIINLKSKTVLWGCSVSEEFLTDEVVEDLRQYSLITVREKKSYDLLVNYKANKNIVQCCDPAFILEPIVRSWPDNKKHNNIIGINLSPLIKHYEKKDNITYNNYCSLINYILSETDMEIALIPHVVKPNNSDNDLIELINLYNEFNCNDRIIKIEDQYNCCELKGFISQCKYFIGARTHATIAAYSSCIPTIVVGYSTKAEGIAEDLFGRERNYIIDVRKLEDENELVNEFKILQNNEEHIAITLNSVMSDYRKRIYSAVDALRKLCD